MTRIPASSTVCLARRLPYLGSVLAVLLLCSGCSMTPEVLTADEQSARVAGDSAKLFSDIEPVTHPITLKEAIDRAVKNNLDLRVAELQHDIETANLQVASYEMLPKALASSTSVTRNNTNASLSRNTSDNFLSVQPATSEDRSIENANLQISWNILDFGVSYYQAKEQGDRVLIADERQRKLQYQIEQQTRVAFWNAATAERLRHRIGPALAEARAALSKTREVESQRLKPLVDTLRVEESLIEIIRQLDAVDQDLAIFKAQLAGLMCLPPGQAFTLSMPGSYMDSVPAFTLSPDEMETIALYNRPELREEGYQSRISIAETRKAMLKMLPSLGINGGLNYTSNSYIVNNFWADAGLAASYNLFSLISGPAAIKAAETQQTLGDARRLALSMAAIIQAHVAQQQLLRARHSLSITAMAQSTASRIDMNTTEASANDALSDVDRIRARANAVLATLARDRAFAETQNAAAGLYISLGLEPNLEGVKDGDLHALARKLKDDVTAWRTAHPDSDPSKT